MLNCGVYRIRFMKPSFELNDEYERLSDYEKERVSELDVDSFFDCDEKDEYTCYVITNPLEMKVYLGILSNNLIGIKFDDLSKDILSRKVDLENELDPQLSTMNSVRCRFFINELNNWIYNNLDIDIVLDRIFVMELKHLQIRKDYF